MNLRRLIKPWVLCGMVIIPAVAMANEKPVLFTGLPPLKIYEYVHQAKWNVDVATVLACTSRRTGATEEQVYKELMQERGTLAQRISLVKKNIQGGVATLVMKGMRRDRETKTIVTSRGTITMVKEDGTWRLRHEQWIPVGTEPDVDSRPAPGTR